VKIYDENSNKINASLQSYFNYFSQPEKECKDRCMPIMNLRNCLKHNRLLFQFSYPKSSLPKLAVVMPYIGDNKIELKKGNASCMITWLANI